MLLSWEPFWVSTFKELFVSVQFMCLKDGVWPSSQLLASMEVAHSVLENIGSRWVSDSQQETVGLRGELSATTFVDSRQETPKTVRESGFSPQSREQLGKRNFRGKRKQTQNGPYFYCLCHEQHALHFMNFIKHTGRKIQLGEGQGMGKGFRCVLPSIIQGPDWSRTRLFLASLSY